MFQDIITKMPNIVTSLKRSSANYSQCPLKKRPIKYDTVEDSSDSNVSYKGIPFPQSIINGSEPENLSTKPEDLKLKQESLSSASSSAYLSPPPISFVVAGRGGSISSPPFSPQYNCSFCGMLSPPHLHQVHHHHHLPSPSQFSPSYLAASQPTKSVSGGPLETISLHPPTAWPKIPAHVIHHSNISAASPVRQRSPFNFDFAPVAVPSSTSPQVSTFAARSLAAIPLFLPTSPSNFAPFNVRDASGSSPHVSPPLSLEPAYPVINIEEPHRVSNPLSYHHHETKFYEDIVTPVSSHQPYYQEVQAKVIKHERHSYSSPSAPEKRDSVISRSSVSSTSSISNSQNQQPIAPPPQLSQITPINVNGSVRYQCPDCNKSYSTFTRLSKHIQLYCASQNRKQFNCKFCDKVYVSMGALNMHNRTHTLPCKCNFCGKAFSRQWLLKGHIRTHTGEKPFFCQHCNRAFADRSNLKAHLQTHSKVKKYSCKHCSKTFSRMFLLVKHEDSGCNCGSSSPMRTTSPHYPVIDHDNKRH